MKRFSRRRRGGGGRSSGPSPLDAALWLGRLGESGVLDSERWVATPHEDIPAHFAILGAADGDDGSDARVVFSPHAAGDALVAALATGARLVEEDGFSGKISVVAPEWSVAARRRLGWVRAELPFRLETIAAPTLAEGRLLVEAEAPIEAAVIPIQQVIAQLTSVAERDLLRRSVTALSGLAVKHGGALRGTPTGIELVVMARRVAEVRLDRGVLSLATLQPQRSEVPLSQDTLASALDALEGQIRRRLNDRKVRDGEDGLRTRLVGVLERSCGLRDSVPWPIGGADRDEVDLVGVDEQGRPVVAAIRQSLALADVGGVLDTLQALIPSLPAVLSVAAPPVRYGSPRLVLAAQEFSAGAIRALAGVSLAYDLFRIESGGSEVVAVAASEAMQSVRDRSARRNRGRNRGRGRSASEGQDVEKVDESEESVEASTAAKPSRDDNGASASEGGGRNRSRRRRRGGRNRSGSRENQSNPGESELSSSNDDAVEAESGFEELSLFDLDDGPEDGRDEAGSGDSRRRRGRNRRRGRRGRRDGDAEGEDLAARTESTSEGGAIAGAEDESVDEDLHEEELEDTLSDLPDELEGSSFADRRRGASGEDEADEDEEEEEGEPLSANLSMGEPSALPEVAAEAPRPRRRAVIVARADRDALVSAILLARDIRVIEGFWIYPQEELMTFFREVATDLAEDIPIHLVGFVPSPAMDVLQAASLYRDRISWYDHREWAPEDEYALKQTLGEDAVHHTVGAGTCLPAVLRTCTRRSRFSDKLVDLATGRFSQHDYERWGRLWWWRLGEAVEKRGDIRSEIASILTGRPSDLAREAVNIEPPPIPPEVAFVNQHDFRLVHFVGFGMLVITAPEDLDPYLVGRIARERLGTQLSLVRQEGGGGFILSGEEPASKRILDVCALVEHLGNKLEWVTALPNDDHVARFQVAELDAHPGRLDEVIGEIAMGRSILER